MVKRVRDAGHAKPRRLFRHDVANVEPGQRQVGSDGLQSDVRRIIWAGEKVASAVGEPLDRLGEKGTDGGMIACVPGGHDAAHRLAIEHDVGVHVLRLAKAVAAEFEEAQRCPFRAVCEDPEAHGRLL
jgi:hypothetical protein